MSKNKDPISLEIYNKNKENKKKKFYYVGSIKKELSLFNLSIKGKKKDLEKRLFDYYDKLNQYENNINAIRFLQLCIRKYITKKKIKTQGIGILNKSKCQNHEDFYTLDSIFDIDDTYFFSYEENNHIYFFDIRSFSKLLDSDNKNNPYTTNKIPKYAIYSYNKRIEYLKKHNINIGTIKQPKLTKEQQFNSYILDIFQKIDMLDVSAGGTNQLWFTNLNLLQLKMFYKVLEDIWNYRAELPLSKKLEIVPNNTMFPITVNEVFYLNNKRNVQKIILKEIDKLISSAHSEEERKTGAYFVLTALVEVSIECANSLPWLIQQH